MFVTVSSSGFQIYVEKKHTSVRASVENSDIRSYKTCSRLTLELTVTNDLELRRRSHGNAEHHLCTEMVRGHSALHHTLVVDADEAFARIDVTQ